MENNKEKVVKKVPKKVRKYHIYNKEIDDEVKITVTRLEKRIEIVAESEFTGKRTVIEYKDETDLIKKLVDAVIEKESLSEKIDEVLFALS